MNFITLSRSNFSQFSSYFKSICFHLICNQLFSLPLKLIDRFLYVGKISFRLIKITLCEAQMLVVMGLECGNLSSEFVMTQIFKQRFIIFEKLRVQLLFKLRAIKVTIFILLLHFIEYGLDLLNNKHTKLAVKSIMHCFKSHYQNKW